MAGRVLLRRGAALALTAALAISVGCAGMKGASAPAAALGEPGVGPGIDVAGATAIAPIQGQVRFDGRSEDKGYAVQATISDDVAAGATVSLIDPATGFTLAGTVTDGAGNFMLNFAGRFIPGDQPYILEAVKGLKDAAGYNAPGSAVVRVRTFARYAGGTWKGLTRGDMTISSATTALTAAAGMKGLKDTQASKPVSALFETLEQGTADGTVSVEGTTVTINARFTPTADVSNAEYKRVYGLVAMALADDADPIASVYRDAGGAAPDTQFLRSAAPTAVLGFVEPKASRGQTITLVGRNLSANAEVWFSGYQGAIDSNLVRVPVAGTVGALSTDRRTLEVTVPAGAASGEVVYRRGLETLRVATLYGIVGTVATVVGTGQGGFNGDGLPGDRTNLDAPYFLTMDARDNLVIGDLGGRIRKWDRVTGAVGTLYSGGGGPVGMDFDSAGTLYFALYGTNYIQKVDRNGVVSTVAGTGERALAGDGGPAIDAKISAPHGLAVDANDNIWFCDYYNARIRRIDSQTQKIETVLTSGCVGLQYGPDQAIYFGNGTAIIRIDTATKAVTTFATGVSAGQDIWVDSIGNVFVATWGPGSNQVQRVDKTTRAVTIVAGNGQDGYSGDGGDPLQAAFFRTSGVAVDRAGNLFVADYSNFRVRYVALP